MFETKNETEEFSPLQTMLFVCWTLLQLKERETKIKQAEAEKYSNHEVVKDAAAEG